MDKNVIGKKGLSSLASVAKFAAALSPNTLSGFWDYEAKVPEELKERLEKG